MAKDKDIVKEPATMVDERQLTTSNMIVPISVVAACLIAFGTFAWNTMDRSVEKNRVSVDELNCIMVEQNKKFYEIQVNIKELLWAIKANAEKVNTHHAADVIQTPRDVKDAIRNEQTK